MLVIIIVTSITNTYIYCIYIGEGGFRKHLQLLLFLLHEYSKISGSLWGCIGKRSVDRFPVVSFQHAHYHYVYCY